MIEIIKDIGAVLGCISVLLGLLCSISKTVRKKIAKLFSKKEKEKDQQKTINDLCNKLDDYITEDTAFKKGLQQDMDNQKEFAKDQCRNNIKDIFYRYCEERKIPLYEYKIASDTYETYSKKLHGNHYIKFLFNEIKKWEIDYTHSFEDED